MTPCEQLAVAALRHVRFGMGRSRHFVVDLAAKPADFELSPRQKWNLGRLAWRYRRQVPREVSDWALEFYAGASAPPPAPRRAVVPAGDYIEPKTRYELAREALKGPLEFGNVEQARANRLLAKRRRMIGAF